MVVDSNKEIIEISGEIEHADEGEDVDDAGIELGERDRHGEDRLAAVSLTHISRGANPVGERLGFGTENIVDSHHTSPREEVLDRF